MNLADVMDEVAERLRTIPTLAGARTHARPPGKISSPSAIVSYPDTYSFDATYGRGSDTMVLPVMVALARPVERTTRDLLAKYVDGSGPSSVKAVLDGDDYTSCDTVRVTGVDFDVQSVAAVDYLMAVFSLDIIGPGAA